MDSVPVAFWIGLGAAISFLVLPFLGYGLITLVEHLTCKDSEENEADAKEETTEEETVSEMDKEKMVELYHRMPKAEKEAFVKELLFSKDESEKEEE